MPYKVVRTHLTAHQRHYAVRKGKDYELACNQRQIKRSDVADALSVYVSCRECRRALERLGLR